MHHLLAPCPACARHVRVDDLQCPFCAASLDDTQRLVPSLALEPDATRGRSRAVLYALGAAATVLAVSSCDAVRRTLHIAHEDEPHAANDIYGSPPSTIYGGPPSPVVDAGTVVQPEAPAYGAPPPRVDPPDAGSHAHPHHRSTIAQPVRGVAAYGGPPVDPDPTR